MVDQIPGTIPGKGNKNDREQSNQDVSEILFIGVLNT